MAKLTNGPDVAMIVFLNAIQRNDLNTCSLLISSRVTNVKNTPSALFIATEFNCLETMSLLIDAGADLDAFDQYHFSVCHVAARNYNLDSLRLLIQRGANVRTVRSAEESLLGIVACSNDDRMALMLLEAGAPLDNLTAEDLSNLVAHSKSVAVLQHLLAHNVDVNSLRTRNGRNLCHMAVWLAHYVWKATPPILRALVDAGVDVNAQAQLGATPLHYAAMTSSVTLVSLLLELGADIDFRDKSGLAAVHHATLAAATSIQLKCVELLLACGADGSLDVSSGHSARQCAIRIQNSATLSDLFEAATEPTGNPDRLLAKIRLDLVRERAFQICVAFQSLQLDALQTCEILMHSFGALGSLIAFHQWWAIATTVKHFKFQSLN